MNQLALDYERPPVQYRKHLALTIVEKERQQFRDDFGQWLDANWHVYVEFERRALKLWDAGRQHYGARSIWETMRYDSAIGELAGEFKLNDHRAPCIARLFLLMNPRCHGFFEKRVGQSAVRAA